MAISPVAGLQYLSGIEDLPCASVRLERKGFNSCHCNMRPMHRPDSLLKLSLFGGSQLAKSAFEQHSTRFSNWSVGQSWHCLQGLHSYFKDTVSSAGGNNRCIEAIRSESVWEPVECICGVEPAEACKLGFPSLGICHGSHAGAVKRFRRQVEHKMYSRASCAFKNPTRLSRFRRKAVPDSKKASSLIVNIFPERKQLFMDMAGVTTPRLESLRISSIRQKRRSTIFCNSNDEASGNPNNNPSSWEDETARDRRSSSSSSTQTWVSKLKQVDWDKIIFKWQKDEPLWSVPWTGQTIFQVMVLWFAAFWVMGSWVIPIGAQLAGFSRHSLSFRGQALYSLITDIAEGAVGVWILKRCLARFHPLPDGWFPISLKGKWLWEACWGCLLFPLVNRLSQLNLFLLPLPIPLTSSYVEQSMMSRDPVATLLYAVVISVCAPVWEEVIFRGFLLPSMTKYLPLWGAISVSALAFALAHFSMQRILPLTFLGLVMGFVFVRSRNLLASIVLHSLWNGFAFLELL